MKGKLIVIMLFCCFLQVGCDTYRTYNYHITNESDSIIKISYKLDGDFINKIILPHTDLLIDSFSTNANKMDLKENIIRRYFDTLLVKHNNNTLLKRNIYKRENWEYNTDDEIKNIYTFKIKNND